MTNDFLCLLSIRRKFLWYIYNSLSQPKKDLEYTIIGSRLGEEFLPPPKKNACNKHCLSQWCAPPHVMVLSLWTDRYLQAGGLTRLSAATLSLVCRVNTELAVGQAEGLPLVVVQSWGRWTCVSPGTKESDCGGLFCLTASPCIDGRVWSNCWYLLISC